MKFRIHIKMFAVNVLNANASVNQQLTAMVAQEQDVSVDGVRNILGFQHILQASIQADRYDGLICAVRFDTKKGNRVLKREYLSTGLLPSLLFNADDLADVALLQNGNDMVGTWSFEAYMTFFDTSRLRVVDERTFLAAIKSLPNYTAVGSIKFAIKPAEVPMDLLPTGERRRARRVREQDMDVTVDINSI